MVSTSKKTRSNKVMDKYQIQQPQQDTKCTKIPSLKEELEDDNRPNLKPVDIFLKYCAKYAKSNFEKNKISIPEYSFKAKDIETQTKDVAVVIGSKEYWHPTAFKKFYFLNSKTRRNLFDDSTIDEEVHDQSQQAPKIRIHGNAYRCKLM